MKDKKYLVEATVCDRIISTPLSKKQAGNSARELKKKIPSAKVRVTPKK